MLLQTSITLHQLRRLSILKFSLLHRSVFFGISDNRIIMSPEAEEDRRRMNTNDKKTAGIIIIGDEILKGHTKDLNASFLLSRLWTNGVNVRKVSFIADNIDGIAEEVKTFSNDYSFVITCGGIGPTHDDMTLEALSKAFDEPLILNEELAEKIKLFTSTDNLSPGYLKMATLPKSSKLITGHDPITNMPVKYPLMNIKNVFVFPGVPEFMQKSFTINQHLFVSNNQFYLMKVYLSIDEIVISKELEEIDIKFLDVNIGSYPMLNDIYKVKLTLESENQNSLNNAFDMLMKMLPSQMIISVKKCEPNSREDHHELINTNEKKRSRIISQTQLSSLSLLDLEHYLNGKNTSSLSSAIKSAWAVFNQTIQMYSLDEICIGFNGGKDCTAVLHLYVAFIKKYFPDNTKMITGLYLKNANPFEEAQAFIKNCEVNYNLNMIVISASIKEGLENLKETHPNIKAVIMGTKRYDPYSSQFKCFTMTDASWPSYMRVFPILDWSYGEVWDFLRTFDLPYCQLYDEGYTSLGDPKNTLKNKSLLLGDGRYSPAYMLPEDRLERDGREKKE